MGVYIPNMKKPNDCDYCKLYTDRYGEDLGIDFYCIVKDVQSDACPLIDIVTCGECNRSGTDGENTFCMWLGALRKPTDFCSYGRRRSK